MKKYYWIIIIILVIIIITSIFVIINNKKICLKENIYKYINVFPCFLVVLTIRSLINACYL